MYIIYYIILYIIYTILNILYLLYLLIIYIIFNYSYCTLLNKEILFNIKNQLHSLIIDQLFKSIETSPYITIYYNILCQ